MILDNQSSIKTQKTLFHYHPEILQPVCQLI